MAGSTPRRFLLRLALLVLPAAGCGTGELFTLTVLHTNDTHARLLELDRFGSTCQPEERPAGGCFGGVARRATLVRRIREERPHVLLLDAGDQFQGTLFYSRFKGLATRRVMNHLGYDAMVPGNHEFDDGPEVLAEFIAGLEFPVVGTNIDAGRVPALARGLRRSVVVEVGGRRIGILGCLTEETVTLSRPGADVVFLPIEATLSAAVAELEAEGIGEILVLSHAGLQRDRRIARSAPGVDVIVGGHTNTLLSNTAPDAEGPYPIVQRGARGDPVLIVTDFAWGKYLGRLEVTFDERGVPVAWSGDPILLDAQVLEDPATLELLAPLVAEVAEYSGEVIGAAAVALDGRERVCRAHECNLGNLVADALLEAHRQQGVEVALQNAGGIRSSLRPGPITVGQILEVLPFGNTASTFELLGSDLLATLEHGVSRAEDLDNDGTGRFLQVAGLRYAWLPSAAVGARIARVDVREPDGSWSPLDPDRVYRLVANDFNRTGGDGYAILAERAIDPYDQGRVIADIVVDHVRSHSPVSPRVESRIERIPAHDPRPVTHE